MLKNADPEERQKWLAKDGQDWSGAFTHDPKAYMDSSGRKRREPGSQPPIHDPHDPSSDDDNIPDDEGDSSDSDDQDLGMQDGDDAQSEKSSKVANKKTEKRKNRGLMQWKPVRVSLVISASERQHRSRANAGIAEHCFCEG